MKKRILAGILSVAMVFCAMTVVAAQIKEPETVVVTTAAAQYEVKDATYYTPDPPAPGTTVPAAAATATGDWYEDVWKPIWDWFSGLWTGFFPWVSRGLAIVVAWLMDIIAPVG
ncbi:MAG: hypothetical protein LBR73_00885 [Oscillospiraceae bacterium]|jgi:hypothetical protein|nr:hypothetical protein [Oscillospiraceae bacterium]